MKHEFGDPTLRRLFKRHIGPLLIVDAGGTIVAANPAAEHLFGVAAGSLAGRGVESLVPERSRTGHAAQRAEFLRRHGQRLMGEGRDVTGIRGDGSEFPAEIGLSQIGDGYVLVTLRDASERVQTRHAMEQLLREVDTQRGLLKLIFDNAPVGLALTEGPQHCYLSANPAQMRIARGKGPLIGRTIAEVWPELVGQPPYLLLEQAYATGRPAHVTDTPIMLHRDRGPEQAYFTMDFVPLRDPGPEVSGLLVVSTETTGIVEASHALAKSEALLRTTFDHAAVGIAHLAPDGRFLRVNRRLGEILGYSADELLRLRFDDVIAPAHQELGPPPLESLARGEQATHTAETRYVRKDGSMVWVHLKISLIRDGEGRPDYFIAVQEDIEDRKRAEEALRSAHSRLQEQTHRLRMTTRELARAEERERRSVAADLHDDIAQLLAAARIKLSGMGRTSRSPVAKELDALLGQINRAVRTLAIRVSPPVLTRLGLSAALEWLGDEIGASHGLRVHMSTQAMPATLGRDEDAIVFRVVRELLLNAAKHSGAREASLEIERGDDELRIRVTDQGKGFDPAAVPAAGDDGGFGLEAARGRIANLGGRTRIDSRPGGGTTVTLTIPLQPTDAEDWEI